MADAIVTETPVDVYYVAAYCPDCKVLIQHTGSVKAGDVKLYEHQCPKCKMNFELQGILPTTTIKAKAQPKNEEMVEPVIVEGAKDEKVETSKEN